MTPKLEYKPIAPNAIYKRLIFTDAEGHENMMADRIANMESDIRALLLSSDQWRALASRVRK